MNSLNKAQYFTILKSQLNKLNFIPEDKFDSIIESLKDVDVIGFDIDFTLLQYNKKNMIKLMYESICKYLINHKNYPKKIKYQYNKDFVQSFAKKGFLIDHKNGNCLQITKDKSIIKCYHGKKGYTQKEINRIYENGKYYLFKKSNFVVNESFYIIMDNFHSQNLPLFMICVDLFDKGELKNINSYKDIIIHMMEGMNYSFRIKPFEDSSTFGHIFPEIHKHPELYLVNNGVEEILIKLKEKQKKLFFATNSNYCYSNFILEKVIGKNYDKYFDLCFYKSSKPSFFQEQNIANAKCFFLDQSEFSCSELTDNI
jgi:HAD superfamily 5'-nucleotidase-like hydrolase